MTTFKKPAHLVEIFYLDFTKALLVILAPAFRRLIVAISGRGYNALIIESNLLRYSLDLRLSQHR